MPRSLNDIIPPSKRRSVMPAQNDAAAPARQEYAYPTRVRRRFPYGTALIAILVVAACAGGLYAFSGAKVEITPRTADINISGDFSATPSTGDLPYEVVTVQKVATQSVPAETTINANDSAQGTITIYNAQPTAQALIKNTRFATSDGLIFRIHDAVNVPGGSSSAPGTITATVYADAPGDKYNIAPSDFTIPGFKGTASFALVYAKSIASMAGGFSGTRPAVSQATKDAQYASMKVSLQSGLQSDLKTKVPSGYVFVPGASFITYGPQPDTSTAANSVNVSEMGTLTAVVFPNGSLAKAIAFKAAGTYTGEPVMLAGTDGLTITPSSASAPSGSAPFTFTMNGSTTLVWTVDSKKIAAAVAGKTRDAAQVVLAGLPEVNKAILILRPFWTSTFPSDPAHITVLSLSPVAPTGK